MQEEIKKKNQKTKQRYVVKIERIFFSSFVVKGGEISQNSPGWKGPQKMIWSNLAWERKPR